MANPDKSSSKGMKLYGGGKELTREEIEQAMEAYQKRRSTPEYQEEQKKLRAFFTGEEAEPAAAYLARTEKRKDGVRYYKTQSGLIFKVDEQQRRAYQFDWAARLWKETPYFYTDLHTGEVDAEEICLG